MPVHDVSKWVRRSWNYPELNKLYAAGWYVPTSLSMRPAKLSSAISRT